jgi:hypothetical protein
MTAVPDIGETFTVTKTWTFRQWRWRPFPWYAVRVITDEHSYRVTGWMRRRPIRQRPDEVRQMIDYLLAEGGLEVGGRKFGPDQVPMEHCRRDEAEYVSGYGVAGTIVRVSDVVVDGRVSWDETSIQEGRDLANALAGEPMI